MKQDLKELVTSSDYKENHSHYIIQCPQCMKGGYSKYKLYITKDYRKGYCHRCNEKYISEDTYTLSNLLNKRGSEKKFYYPESFEKYQYAQSYNGDIINYLKKRNRYLEPDKYKIKYFCDIILIPFYFGEQLIYWVERNMYNLPKYKCPKTEKKPLYLLGNYTSSKIVVVEGVFDAIATNIMAPEVLVCAVLGSSMTSYQWGMLKDFCIEQIYVSMDNEELTNNLIKTLKHRVNSWQKVQGLSICKEEEDMEEFLMRVGKEKAREIMFRSMKNIKINRRFF